MNNTYRNFLFIILFAFIFLGATCGGKNEKSQQSSNKQLPVEPIDSVYLENFLLSNPEYKSQRKKLFKFYNRRNFSLAWFDKKDLVPQAGMFLNMLNNIETEGLPAAKFDFKKLLENYNKVAVLKKNDATAIEVKDLDLMLTASYFTYVKNLWHGAVDSKDEDIEWFVQRKKIKYGKTLDAILEAKGDPFSKFEPLNPEYKKLKVLLADYRAIEKKGGWPVISIEQKLVKGDTSAQILNVKKYFNVTGDLKSSNQKNLLDESVEEAVKAFQKRHGLTEDGILGGKTVEEMNTPITKRIEQIIINMERWRWVPQNFSDNYLMVNIPEYKLRIYEKEKEVMNMNVIVGKAANSTPIFNDELEFVVFNPYWNLPKSIVINEMLTLLRKNPVIIEKENMEVYQGKPENLIDPYTVDWNAVDSENPPYQIRQKPGGNNALGKMKFLFPNEYDVYLHDTPGHELFSQAKRGFSHGCIRLEKPKELALYLLRNDAEWNNQNIDQLLTTDEEKFVKLQKKVPVYILYFTSWVDAQGIPHFRDDIYSHDEKLAKSFFEK